MTAQSGIFATCRSACDENCDRPRNCGRLLSARPAYAWQLGFQLPVIFRLHGGRSGGLRFANPPYETYPRAIARLATASPISTNADVTSGPPTKIRVGV